MELKSTSPSPRSSEPSRDSAASSESTLALIGATSIPSGWWKGVNRLFGAAGSGKAASAFFATALKKDLKWDACPLLTPSFLSRIFSSSSFLSCRRRSCSTFFLSRSAAFAASAASLSAFFLVRSSSLATRAASFSASRLTFSSRLCSASACRLISRSTFSFALANRSASRFAAASSLSRSRSALAAASSSFLAARSLSCCSRMAERAAFSASVNFWRLAPDASDALRDRAFPALRRYSAYANGSSQVDTFVTRL
mmetsp:Transcript_19294/g.50161  ORF Transcript_19294/g.50161 Transcript_19294/m.50161 type:complete len:255 (-) Transcript_19294:543-1307(-)